MAELRSLVRYCEFKDSLEDMLRDRLVCGFNDAHIQNRLLGESELTIEKAFAVAMGFEAATKGAQEIVKVESDRDKRCMPWQSGLPTMFSVWEKEPYSRSGSAH